MTKQEFDKRIEEIGKMPNSKRIKALKTLSKEWYETRIYKKLNPVITKKETEAWLSDEEKSYLGKSY